MFLIRQDKMKKRRDIGIPKQHYNRQNATQEINRIIVMLLDEPKNTSLGLSCSGEPLVSFSLIIDVQHP